MRAQYEVGCGMSVAQLKKRKYGIKDMNLRSLYNDKRLLRYEFYYTNIL